MSDDENTIRSLVYDLMVKIVHRQDISDVFHDSRVESSDFFRVLEEYGRTIVVPPADSYADITPVKVENSEHQTWAVDAPMWTLEEGRSDLSIELTIELGDNRPKIQIDDLRVM
jgi:hypothetical protein